MGQIQNWFQESQAGRQCKGRQPRNFYFLQLMLNAHFNPFSGQFPSSTTPISLLSAVQLLRHGASRCQNSGGGGRREPHRRRRLSTAAAVYKFSPIVEGGGEKEDFLSFLLSLLSSPLTDLRFFSMESAPPVKCERSERGRPRSSVRMFDLLSP